MKNNLNFLFTFLFLNISIFGLNAQNKIDLTGTWTLSDANELEYKGDKLIGKVNFGEDIQETLGLVFGKGNSVQTVEIESDGTIYTDYQYKISGKKMNFIPVDPAASIPFEFTFKIVKSSLHLFLKDKENPNFVTEYIYSKLDMPEDDGMNYFD